jgi:hypothetical protein
VAARQRPPELRAELKKQWPSSCTSMEIEKLEILDYSCPRDNAIATKQMNLCDSTAMPKLSPHTCMLV